MSRVLILIICFFQIISAQAQVPENNFALGIGLFNLKPSTGHNDIFSVHQETTGRGNQLIINDFDPGHAMGIQIKGLVLLDDQNDLTFTWLHHTDKTNRSEFHPIPISDANVRTPFMLEEAVTSIVPRQQSLLNIGNLEFGHTFNWVNDTVFRLFFGLQGAEFGRDIQLILFNHDADRRYAFYDDSHMTGMGVRGGAGFKTEIIGNFSVAGQFSGGLLAAKQRHLARYFRPGRTIVSEVDIIIPDHENHWQHSQYIMVGFVDANARVEFQHALSNGHLTWFAGWQFFNYSHANRALHGATFDGDDIVLDDNAMGLQGPMFGFVWTGHA